ncbi:hypothetical protein BP5796_12609 [Coleophoma crateriformis]|uniref:Uncharacterized protein n=1 Tax=Coleophoma crateriformis TaxID=565419 RepID=A0A3D8Q850_9HELO|nr:hypothetical protein BP5796_12609 [Coleophoma crateriformis]
MAYLDFKSEVSNSVKDDAAKGSWSSSFKLQRDAGKTAYSVYYISGDAFHAQWLAFRLGQPTPINGAYTERYTTGFSKVITIDHSACWVIPWGQLQPVRQDIGDSGLGESGLGTGLGAKFGNAGLVILLAPPTSDACPTVTANNAWLVLSSHGVHLEGAREFDYRCLKHHWNYAYNRLYVDLTTRAVNHSRRVSSQPYLL